MMATSQWSVIFLLACGFIVIPTGCHSLFNSQPSELDKINEALRFLQKDNSELKQKLGMVTERLDKTAEQLDRTAEKLDNVYEANSELKKKLNETRETVSRLLHMMLNSQSLEESVKDLKENDDMVEREVLSGHEKVDYSDLLSKLSPSVLQSLRGRDGKDGATGAQGPPGKDGAPGEQGPPGREASLSAIGAVYTRWGRTTCGEASRLIYSGFAAGPEHEQSGGGSNYQCLPLTPEYNKYGNTLQRGGFISGVEYQTGTAKSGIFSSQTHNSNAPCARCYTEKRSAVMMIPAKRYCPTGWIREYEDAEPETIPGSNENLNGALFYFIRPYCSGVGNIHHCPPYYADRELTCVVCSK